jgi:cytochrome P450
VATAEPALAPKFDVADPQLRTDPYAVYARLRAAGLCRGAPGQWVVTRHADVAALLRDPRLTKQLPAEYYRVAGAAPRLEAFLARMNMGRRDGDLARRVGRAFRAPHVQSLHARMEELLDELLAPLAERREFDLARELALPFPMMVMCELLGIPASDRDAVWPRAATLLASFSDAAFLSERDLGEGERALDWLVDYLSALLAERRRRPADDLVSSLASSSEHDRMLTDEEIVDSVIRVFYAGFETSKGMLANGVAALLERPDEHRRLLHDRTLVPPAVEEFLRYDAPIQVSLRRVLEPIRLGERTLRSGRVLVLLIGSANHDESAFAEPSRLDVARRPNPHLSFGGGPSFCLGAALARQEGAVALRGLLDRFRSIAPAGPVRRPPLVNLRCVEALPVAVRPR